MPSHPEQPACAVIIGLESMQGLQAARILYRHRIPVIAVVAERRHVNALTTCCQAILPEGPELIATLETLGRRLAQPAVLFPCTDASVLAVSRARQHLETWFRLRLPAPEVVETMFDKRRFHAFAEQHHFTVPRTHVLHDETDLAAACADLTFPCILKPYYRDAVWNAHSAFKAFKAATPAELSALYLHYRPWCETFLAQEWIDGPDASLYSCNCYFAASGEPLATFVARKLRQWPPETGQSSLGEECRDDEVLQETLRFFRTAGFRGLGYLEMKRDRRSGRLFLVEPNIGRPTGRSAIAEAGGVELLYTMYCDVLGLPLPSQRTQHYGRVKWIHLRRDLQSAWYYWRKGELTLTQWWQSWRGTKAYALFSWRDPGPFLGDLLRAVWLVLSRTERQRRDFRHPLLTPAGDKP